MKFMKQALLCAQRAYNHDDVPIGAVVVRDGKIIARGEKSGVRLPLLPPESLGDSRL